VFLHKVPEASGAPRGVRYLQLNLNQEIILKLHRNAGKIAASALAALSLTLMSAAPSSAAAVSDPPNDFLPTFAGPHNGDLDVLSTNATVSGSFIDVTATLNGNVGQTPGAQYVFGFDRGKGTPKFANIGNPNVIFDSTAVLNFNQGKTSQVNDLISKQSFALDGATASGNTISAAIPLSNLPSEGFSPNNYTFNLWPETVPANPANTEISDFAPDNAMARVSSAGTTATPEPGTMSLFGMAAVGVFAAIRRRKSA
jgi:PEP-CTERM motif